MLTLAKLIHKYFAMNHSLTFDQLPQAVALLTKEVSEIKQLLLSKAESQPSESQELLLSIQEAADFLNLKVPTVYTKVSRSELPVMKRGKQLYFSRTELLNYIKEGRKKSNAEIDAEAESYLRKKGGRNG